MNLFGQLVGFLGRGITPTQGLYLHRITQDRKMRTHIHAPSGIRSLDPSFRTVQHISTLDRAAIGIDEKIQFENEFSPWRYGFSLTGLEKWFIPWALRMGRVNKTLCEIWGFKEIMIQFMVFWIVTSCSVVVGFHRFGGRCCLYLQGSVSQWGKQVSFKFHWQLKIAASCEINVKNYVLIFRQKTFLGSYFTC
jgi:hypothetical protein